MMHKGTHEAYNGALIGTKEIIDRINELKEGGINIFLVDNGGGVKGLDRFANEIIPNKLVNLYKMENVMKFKITRANENKFESGLRGFFEYKNLGIEDATSGNFGANVIKAIEGKHANGEWHYHKVDFQMVYILKGTVKFEYEGHEYTLYPGDVVYQPPEIIEKLNILMI